MDVKVPYWLTHDEVKMVNDRRMMDARLAHREAIQRAEEEARDPAQTPAVGDSVMRLGKRVWVQRVTKRLVYTISPIIGCPDHCATGAIGLSAWRKAWGEPDADGRKRAERMSFLMFNAMGDVKSGEVKP